MAAIPFQVVVYVVVVVADVEKHHSELGVKQMGYDGVYADMGVVEIEEASFAVVQIRGEKEEIHHHRHHHRPFPFLCPNNRQVLCVRWPLHTIFDVSLYSWAERGKTRTY